MLAVSARSVCSTAAELDTVFVAGGFGYHLNPLHARAIGLLPDVDFDRIDLIGNSSLGGASLLLGETGKELLEPLGRRCGEHRLRRPLRLDQALGNAPKVGVHGAGGA